MEIEFDSLRTRKISCLSYQDTLGNTQPSKYFLNSIFAGMSGNRFQLKTFILILIEIVISFQAQSQITVDTSFTAEQLVKKLAGNQGVVVGNITVTGPHLGYGFFKDAEPAIGIDQGIILSSGSVFDAFTPNNLPYKTGYFSDPKAKKKPKGDKDLNRISHGISGDAVVIEFDFIPLNNKIMFNYVFGSEEYPEYVGSKYNDVFAFIVNGEKVRRVNIATIPGVNFPVSINTLNNKLSNQYYIDNDYYKKPELKKKIPMQKKKKTPAHPKNKVSDFKISKSKKKKLNQEIVNNVQYDGLTGVMTASCYVVPYKKYHLKIAIADVGDLAYDSGVMLEAGSLISLKDPGQPKFKDYPDLSNKLDFKSIFAGKIIPDQQSKQDSIDDAEQDRFAVTNINFLTASAVIPDTAKHNLDALAEYLMRHMEMHCELTGYTDNVGSKKYNQNLSEKRANAVMDYLIKKGVAWQRLKIEGYNFEDPIADNSVETGRAANRRVEIVLFDDSAVTTK